MCNELNFSYEKVVQKVRGDQLKEVAMRIDILKKIRKDDSGATAIEYGLIAALVSVAAIGALTAMGGSLNAMFTTVSSALSGAAGG